MKYNQLSRYGAIAKALPFTTGKIFFLVSSTEAAANNFQESYPVDEDGRVRVFTSWADVITELTTVTDSSVVIVSPLFTTAPTLAQITSLNGAGATVIQAGQNLPDGSYLATKAAHAISSKTTITLFQVNGRVLVQNILGEVVTTIGASASTTNLTAVPTVGSTANLCSGADLSALAVGGQIYITGTPANAMVCTTQGVTPGQAAALMVKAGNIFLQTTATTTGNIRWRVHYKPLDPGAFISAV